MVTGPADRHFRSALRQIGEGEFAARALEQGGGDEYPEPRAARAAARGAEERFAQVRQQVIGEARTIVGHGNLDCIADGGRCKRNDVGRVTARICDQIVKSVQKLGRACHARIPERRCDIDRNALARSLNQQGGQGYTRKRVLGFGAVGDADQNVT